MKQLILSAFAAALIACALAGYPQQALYAALFCALADVCALFAPEMYHASAAMEVDDLRRGGLWRMALLMGVIGTAVSVLVAAAVGLAGPVPAVYMLVRFLVEWLRVRPGRGARFGLEASLFRALPEALLLRGLFVVPAAALLAGAWYGWGVNTVPAYAAGLLAFCALRMDARPSGAEAERFPVRWIFGAAATAVCVLLGWNGVFSAAYCAWGAVVALLPVKHGAKAWLCALLVTLQAALGWAGVTFGLGHIAAALAFAAVPVVILLQRRAVYAAYLPLRAWMIRRRAK